MFSDRTKNEKRGGVRRVYDVNKEIPVTRKKNRRRPEKFRSFWNNDDGLFYKGEIPLCLYMGKFGSVFKYPKSVLNFAYKRSPPKREEGSITECEDEDEDEDEQ